MKIKMLHPLSVVSSITIDPRSPLAKNPKGIKMLQHCRVIHTTNDELNLAYTYAWPGGYGRSIRAIVLGLNYKSASRESGGNTEFFYEMFNLPQCSTGYQGAMEASKK